MASQPAATQPSAPSTDPAVAVQPPAERTFVSPRRSPKPETFNRDAAFPLIVGPPVFSPSAEDLSRTARSLISSSQNFEADAALDWLLTLDPDHAYGRCMQARLKDHFIPGMSRFGKGSYRAEHHWLGRMTLDSKLPEFTLQGVRLADAFDLISDVSLLEVTVNWVALGKIGVRADQLVSVAVPAGTLESSIKTILDAASTPDARVGFRVVNEKIDRLDVAPEDDLFRRSITQRAYSVKDLVDRIPAENAGTERDPPTRRPVRLLDARLVESEPIGRKDDLMKLITDTIAPDTWKSVGGDIGDIWPGDGTIVVVQTTENHRAVAGLLERVRDQQLLRTPIEVCIIRADRESLGGILQKLGKRTPDIAPLPLVPDTPLRPDAPVQLDEDQVLQLLDALSNDESVETVKVRHLAGINGQVARISLSLVQPYTYDYRREEPSLGPATFEPVNRHATTGLTLSISGIASADRQYVTLAMNSKVEWLSKIQIIPWPDRPDGSDLQVQRVEKDRQTAHEVYSAPKDTAILVAGPASYADDGKRDGRQYFFLVRPTIVERRDAPTLPGKQIGVSFTRRPKAKVPSTTPSSR